MTSRRDATRLTRRQWTLGLTAAGAAAPLIAQTTSRSPPQGSPAPAQPTATPEQKLQKAYADVHQLSDHLSKIELPMDVEPAFAFRP